MTETPEKPIRVGSRKSELALIQTKYVIAQLQKLYPEKCFEIHTMSTIGDRVLNVSLPKIGEKSLFTRDLEDALRNGGVDFVVHSLKDLPTALPSGMAIGAVLEREDSRDALVLNEKYKGNTIDTLPAGCIIGTSSLRRTAQLRRLYPHLEVCDIRGNLNTRLAKLDAINSKFAGIILAQAGLLRMGWMNRISQVLEPNHLLYAVGQGALAVECRSNDEKILSMLKNLMCLTTTCRILAERSFLKTLGGGCSAPVAVSTIINNNDNDNSRLEKNGNNDDISLDITGAVWSLDGATEIKDSINCYLTIERKRKISEKSEKNIIEGNNFIGGDGDGKNVEKIDDDDDNDDESPKKRKKLDDDDEQENDKEQNKQGSPKIVNDDKFTQDLIGKAVTSGAGDGIKLSDLQYLINIHGELFKKCPFYAQHQKDRENGNVSTKKDECPLNIPIGQDFMGKCPYVNTSEQVELSEKFGNVCPITGKMGTTTGGIGSSNNNNNDPFAQGDTKATPNTQNQQQKCPFSGKTIIDNKKKTATTTTTTNKTQELGHKDCPFIQKNIKMYDYDDEKQKKFIETKHSTSIDDNTIEIDNLNEQLFCGLYRHKIFKHDLFLKCEKLGQKLAEHLICKGALDIMKCAQQEIRDK